MKLKIALLNRPPKVESSISGIEVGIAATVDGLITSGRVLGRPGPRLFAAFAYTFREFAVQSGVATPDKDLPTKTGYSVDSYD